MSADRATLEDVERLAKMAGLMIDPAYLPTVASNLRILLDQAALFVDRPIDPIVEPAPVFHP
ncbi:DUF4089 domain-containing protein [Rhizorhabdus argentea]|uniref:DUF4089 domain-containing protein n=1 Tax=Rhizorhabdus argentea TaxID=1387174 RepID=UPI0030EEC3CD